MHSTPTISLYAFVVVLAGLGLPGLAVWALFRVLFSRGSDAPRTPDFDSLADEEWLSAPPAMRRDPPMMPPSAPRDEREYFQAARYAMEHHLTPPPLPPCTAREE